MRSAPARRRTIVSEADASLVVAAAGGDGEAFDELYRRHAPAAWRVANSVVRNLDDASDAVAEAFAKVFPGPAGRVGPLLRPGLPGLVLSATRRGAIDVLRRTSRVAATGDVEATYDEGRTVPSPGRSTRFWPGRPKISWPRPSPTTGAQAGCPLVDRGGAHVDPGGRHGSRRGRQ